MECGHVALGVDANGKPICPICAGIHKGHDVISKILKDDEELEERNAKCGYCLRETPSSWDLPFFKYCPNEEQDEYYCGCYGWD